MGLLLYRKLGGPQGRCGRLRKISPPPPVFDLRTIQSVARRYTIYVLIFCKFLVGAPTCSPLFAGLISGVTDTD